MVWLDCLQIAYKNSLLSTYLNHTPWNPSLVIRLTTFLENKMRDQSWLLDCQVPTFFLSDLNLNIYTYLKINYILSGLRVFFSWLQLFSNNIFLPRKFSKEGFWLQLANQKLKIKLELYMPHENFNRIVIDILICKRKPFFFILHKCGLESEGASFRKKGWMLC